MTLVAACGGESPDAVTAASARPTAQPTTTAVAATPTPSATQVPQASNFKPALSVAATNLPDLDVVDSPANVARKYGGATVPVAARIKTLKDLDAKWTKDFASMPRADREKAAVAWLGARPEIEAAGVSSTGVWARFKDGKMIIAPTYAWPKPAPRQAARETLRDSMNAKADVPQSKSRSLPDWFLYDTNKMIATWLGAHGYEDAGSSIKVGPLRTQVKNAGVFYINTHGGMGVERNLAMANRPAEERHWDALYSFYTESIVLDTNGDPMTHNFTRRAQLDDIHNNNPNDKSQIEDDLAHGMVVYFYADTGDGSEWHYGITHRFVTKYMSFADDSFVFLNACSSQSDESVLMTAAFKKKNAGFIAGWDHVVSPNTAMRVSEFMFDRLLGANQMSNWGLKADKPKQRPWNVGSTFADIQGKGYDHETNDRNELCTLKYVGDTSIVLVPIIEKMEADDVKHVLTLHGTFGDDPSDKDRHVKIGGADCPVKEWSATQITCDLGTDFKKGDVVVDKQGRKSNAAPLTSWNVHIRYKIDMGVPGGFGMGMGFDAHVRADVHKLRASPVDPPQAREAVAFYGAPDSKCGSAGDKGDYSANGGHAWMSSGTTIPIAQGPPTGGDFCLIYGQADTQASKLKVAIMAVTRNGAGAINVAAPGVSTSRSFGMGIIPAPGIFDGALPPPPGLPPQASMPTAIFLPMDEKGNIAAGKRGPADLGNSGKAKVSLEWDAAQADDYPTDDTAQ